MQQRTHPISIIPHKTKKSYHQVLCAKYDMLRDTLKTEYEFNFFILAKIMEKSAIFGSFTKLILASCSQILMALFCIFVHCYEKAR